jgi:hypothetical protein
MSSFLHFARDEYIKFRNFSTTKISKTACRGKWFAGKLI